MTVEKWNDALENATVYGSLQKQKECIVITGKSWPEDKGSFETMKTSIEDTELSLSDQPFVPAQEKTSFSVEHKLNIAKSISRVDSLPEQACANRRYSVGFEMALHDFIIILDERTLQEAHLNITKPISSSQ